MTLCVGFGGQTLVPELCCQASGWRSHCRAQPARHSLGSCASLEPLVTVLPHPCSWLVVETQESKGGSLGDRWVPCGLTGHGHSISKVASQSLGLGFTPPPSQGKNVASPSQTLFPEAAPDPPPLAGSVWTWGELVSLCDRALVHF